MSMTITRLSVLLSILLIISCKEPKGSIVHLNKQDFSPEEEMKIGLAIRDEVLSLPENFPILDKTNYNDAYDYVGTLFRMLQNTSQVINRNLYNWDLHIVNDDELKCAFITPGGHLFMYTGLLKVLNTESELVNLMAHEIYYAEKGYAVIRLKEEYSDLADLLLDDVDPPFVTDLAKDLNNITYASKEVEKADQFAIDLLCPFQYDATGLKSILEIAEDSGHSIDWLNIRPGLENRKAEIETRASSCGVEESTFADRYIVFKTEMLPD